MERFVHLRVHSEFSLLEGACRIEGLVKQAKDLGMDALAITDYGTMYGTIPFYKACLRHGVKPLIGVTMDVIQGDLADRVRDESRHSLVLIAENDKGYKNLLKLVTEASLQTSYGKPRVNKSLLRTFAEGLIAFCSGMSGEIQQLLQERNFNAAMDVAKEYEGIFGSGSFFLELQDHGLEDQRLLNQRILQCSRDTGVPLIVTNSVHYLDRKDALNHDILLCIGTGKHLSDSNRTRFPNDQFYLKSQEEMIKLFPYAREAVRNTISIAKRCEVNIPFGQYILPQFPLPEGETSERFLRRLCEEGLEMRYGTPPQEAKERLAYELSVIERMGFSDYFLIVWDFMRFAHQQKIVTGPGRGSAAGSLVAYTLRITNVDPLKYQLLFERFLNPERISMPDIDIDFEVERRGEVIDYVSKKYGKEYVAQIITFGTMAARAAIRDVGRVMNYPAHVVDQTAKLISQGMTLDEAVNSIPELKKAHEESEEVEKLIRFAKGIEGLPRHASTHAAGIVISKAPLTDYVPLQQGNEGHSLTQFSMEHLEEIGLLKMDFLGLRNLTIIELALSLIRQNQNVVSFRLEDIPHDDEKTFSMLTHGDTTGIFQLESSGMRNVLREVRPSSLEDIIAILALYRPGPMEIIPDFAAAKNGRKQVSYLHDDLRPILQDTYGFILYQEQIMQIASQMAGYTLGQADVLRRAVSKKKREVLEEQREQFVSGCIQKGYPEKTGQELYDLIVRFADYGFNRSHSAAYSLIAYQMAYLKANYPREFLTALLSLSIGNAAKVAEYVDECRKRSIPVMLPDINHSSALFSIRDNGILFGLSAIKNVGMHAVQIILEERKRRGNFRSLSDFCRRVDSRVCNRRVLEALIQSGAFDPLAGHRAQKLSILDVVLEKAQGWRKDHADGQVSLFSEGTQEEEVRFPEIPPFTKKECLDLEKELLGLFVSGHPLDEYDPILNRKEVIPLHRLDQFHNQTVMVAGMIAESRVITTRKGVPMAFAMLEDKVSQLELVVFPAAYEKEPSLWKKNKKVVVQGKVEKQDESTKLIANKVWDMDSLLLNAQKKEEALFIKVTEELERSSKLLDIQKVLLKYAGTSVVYLYYEKSKETKKLQDKYHVTIHSQLVTDLENLAGTGSVIVKEWKS